MRAPQSNLNYVREIKKKINKTQPNPMAFSDISEDVGKAALGNDPLRSASIQVAAFFCNLNTREINAVRCFGEKGENSQLMTKQQKVPK